MTISKILLLLQLTTLTLQLPTRCIHDHITKNKTTIFINDTEQHQRRLLQDYGYGPIRMHYEYNGTTISDGDLVGRNLKKIMNIIGEFWARTIEIEYIPALSF